MAATSTLIFLELLPGQPLIYLILQAAGLRWSLPLLQSLGLQLQFLQPKLKWIDITLIITNSVYFTHFE